MGRGSAAVATGGLRELAGHRSTRPLWGQRLSLLSGRGQPVSFVRIERPARRRAWRPVGYWGFAMEQGGEGGMDIIPPGWQEKAILVLPPEAKPCKSHDGGGGTAPGRGEKGGCHARCT